MPPNSADNNALNGGHHHHHHQRKPPPPPAAAGPPPTPPLPPPPSAAVTAFAPHNHHHRGDHGGGHHHHHHPRHHHYHPYYPSYSTSSKASVKGCCCCLLLLLSLLFLIAIAVALVVVLAVKPKKPQFDLQQVSVQYMGINTPNPTAFDPATAAAASISLAIHMLFTAVNPNKVGIKYGESRFTVMYRGIPLGKASVPGFFQEAHSERKVEATVAVDRYSLMQADAADLIRDASLNDRVELRVLGEVGAKIRVMEFDSPGVQVSVDCAIVISPRKQSVTYKQCGFDGLSV